MSLFLRKLGGMAVVLLALGGGYGRGGEAPESA